MTKVNITIFSYYNDLCVHNFSSGMSSRRSLIGRLQGPQREMTESALEKWECRLPFPAHPHRGGLNKSQGKGSQLFNFSLTWSLLMKYKEEGMISNLDDLGLGMRKWLPRALETTETQSSGNFHSKTTILQFAVTMNHLVSCHVGCDHVFLRISKSVFSFANVF